MARERREATCFGPLGRRHADRLADRERAAVEVGARPRVPAHPRLRRGGEEPVERAAAQLLRPRGLHLAAEEERLLGVVGEDVDQVIALLAERVLDPAHVAVVELRAFLLGHALVGDLVDEDVLEPIRPPTAGSALVRLGDEVAADPFAQRLARRGLTCGERREAVGPEQPAHHRTSLQETLQLGARAVDARGDQALQRLWQDQRADVAARDPAVVAVLDLAGLDEHAQELLDVQGVAVGPLDHLGPQLFGERVDGEELRDEPAGLVFGQRLELDGRRVAAAAAPVRAVLEELGSREAQHEQRGPGPFDDVFDEIEESRLGPVDVLEHERDRLLGGPPFEEPAEAPAELVRDVFGRDLRQRDGGRGEPREDREPPSHRVALLRRLTERGEDRRP